MSAVALVSGANRGIGLEVCRQLAARGYAVALGSRDTAAGEAAARGVEGDVRAVQLDVTDEASVDAAVAFVRDAFGRLDLLVNNGAVYPGGRATAMDMQLAADTFATNALGPWRLAVACAPLLRASPAGRIVNVSSESGSLELMDGSTPAYNVSKAALNAVTRVLAADLRRDGVLVNAVTPGWVRTRMGGPGASRSLEEGAASVLWAATLPDDGPTGGFFRDGEPMPW